MKPFLPFLIASCALAADVPAQTYHPLLDSVANHWTFISNHVPVRLSQTGAPCSYAHFNGAAEALYTTTDTLMGSETYKILMRSDFNAPGSECLYGYLREDTATQRVYFVDNLLSPEILLYDFSLPVGGTIPLTFVYGLGLYYNSGTYQVDSIGTVAVNTGMRRIFYLSLPGSPTSYPLEWIESVGHPGYLVYPYSLNISLGEQFWCNDHIARDYYALLTCFEHDTQKVWFDSCAHAFAFNNGCFDYQDSCNFWNICSSINDPSPILNWQVIPNPSQGPHHLVLGASSHSDITLTILNAEGREIRRQRAYLDPGQNSLEINTKNCIPGVYILMISWDSGSGFAKLVVSP